MGDPAMGTWAVESLWKQNSKALYLNSNFTLYNMHNIKGNSEEIL